MKIPISIITLDGKSVIKDGARIKDFAEDPFPPSLREKLDILAKASQADEYGEEFAKANNEEFLALKKIKYVPADIRILHPLFRNTFQDICQSDILLFSCHGNQSGLLLENRLGETDPMGLDFFREFFPHPPAPHYGQHGEFPGFEHDPPPPEQYPGE